MPMRIWTSKFLYRERVWRLEIYCETSRFINRLSIELKHRANKTILVPFGCRAKFVIFNCIAAKTPSKKVFWRRHSIPDRKQTKSETNREWATHFVNIRLHAMRAKLEWTGAGCRGNENRRNRRFIIKALFMFLFLDRLIFFSAFPDENLVYRDIAAISPVADAFYLVNNAHALQRDIKTSRCVRRGVQSSELSAGVWRSVF